MLSTLAMPKGQCRGVKGEGNGDHVIKLLFFRVTDHGGFVGAVKEVGVWIVEDHLALVYKHSMERVEQSRLFHNPGRSLDARQIRLIWIQRDVQIKEMHKVILIV